MKFTKAHLRDSVHGRIVRFIFKGEDRAIKVTKKLIRESAWFNVTPLPEDEWVVEVRRDRSRVVEQFLSSSN